MNKFLLTIVIVAFHFVSFNGMQAQGLQTKPDQTELMKKFVGNWELKLTKDTTILFDIKPFGTGLEGEAKGVTKGRVFAGGKQLLGYDSKNDIFIISFLKAGQDIELIATWFVSETNYKRIAYEYFHNPEEAPWEYEGAFKSPDIFEETLVVKNKPMGKDVYTRIK
jgi:hypothetical protein